MIFVLEENKARKIFKTYGNVAAFSIGKTKGINDTEVEINYAKLDLIPDMDELNAIVSGDVKGKKVIKKAVKALHAPSAENQNICMSMAQLVNMVSPEAKTTKKTEKKLKKHGPNIIVFVMDDAGEDKTIKARNKFLVKYMAALFGEFGITVVDSEKVTKKLFGKGKKKKIVERVTKFIKEHDEVRISNKGYTLKKILFNFYAIELRQSSLSSLELDDLSKDQIKRLLKTMIETYTNDNMKVAAAIKDKKEVKKVCKGLKKKNKLAVAAYGAFVDIMATVDPEMKLPKVKAGYKKSKPKMDIEKFVKFFTRKKYRNVYVLMMLYAHTAAMLMDVTPGSSEYNKLMSSTIGHITNDETMGKAWTAAAKAWTKAQTAAQA